MSSVSRYEYLLKRRAHARRVTALTCAQRALDALSAMGVKARLIGSLAAEPAKFRHDSDIDTLVEDRNGIAQTALFLEAEKHIDGIAFDLAFLEAVPTDMRQFL